MATSRVTARVTGHTTVTGHGVVTARMSHLYHSPAAAAALAGPRPCIVIVDPPLLPICITSLVINIRSDPIFNRYENVAYLLCSEELVKARSSLRQCTHQLQLHLQALVLLLQLPAPRTGCAVNSCR